MYGLAGFHQCQGSSRHSEPSQAVGMDSQVNAVSGTDRQGRLP